MWEGRANEGGDGAYLTFVRGEEGAMSAVLVGVTQTSDGRAPTFYGVYDTRTATLGHYAYINARILLEDGKPPEGATAKNIVPLLYQIRGNRLELYLLDEKATADAVHSGQIAGHVEQGTYGDVEITADPAALDRFFASPAARALFTKPFLVLHRLK